MTSLRPILLIEDNAMDVDLTRRAFHEHGITNPFAVCFDGEEALNYIESHATPADMQLPIIALIDLHLPKIDGTEVMRRARAHPVWKRVPFIVLTTSRHESDIASAYECGANSYIAKPVDFTTFTEVARIIKIYWLQINEPPFRDATK
jgi:CheY-like chemotaxis protein